MSMLHYWRRISPIAVLTSAFNCSKPKLGSGRPLTKNSGVLVTFSVRASSRSCAITLAISGALASALGRPQNKWAYENADLAIMAAAYAFGIAKNHPFVDGNKRAAFMAMVVFLNKNGIAFAPSEPESTAIMIDLASGAIDEDGLTRWIRDNWPAATP